MATIIVYKHLSTEEEKIMNFNKALRGVNKSSILNR
jgi:hypothetical protein